MAYEWISAANAVRYLTDDMYSHNEQRAICVRAHSGIVAAKAETLLWNEEERKNTLIPKNFWWAEGQEALQQDWTAGDFSTWIDRSFEAKAFGVQFDFLAITELAPAERRAVGMQRMSVVGSDQWIPASEFHRLVYSKNAISASGGIILQACATGQLVARAVRATGSIDRKGQTSSEWAAREWDVPLWFWRDFSDPESSRQDWALSKVRGQGLHNSAWEMIELQGLHFHSAGLASLGLPPASPTPTDRGNPAGRRPKYNWARATAAVWGRLYRGELKPETQSDIERALQAELAEGDDEPSESTVRPYASDMWEEFQKG